MNIDDMHPFDVLVFAVLALLNGALLGLMLRMLAGWLL